MTVRDDLLETMTYILRRVMPSKVPKSQWWKRDDSEAPRVAHQVVEHLELSGFTFGKKTPAKSHSWPPSEAKED